jgi:hypothetical protein
MKAISAALILATTAIVAQRAEGTRGPDNNPGQIVCVKQQEIGSRVSARRVCRTRAEWAEHREHAREVAERVQVRKATECTGGGSPSTRAC